jgi:hypothetical protein
MDWKDMEGSGCGLIRDNTPTLAWSGGGNPLNISLRIAGLLVEI